MTSSRVRRRWLWIGLAVLALVAAPFEFILIGRLSGSWKQMYVVAESMEPTLKRGDRFLAWTRAPATISRGDILLVTVRENVTYVQRVAAISGDTIEVLGGLVVINGRPVQQRRIGSAQGFDGRPAALLSEQFPGEATPHHIYDSGYTDLDDFPAQRVAPGHIFLLGDNRDVSADSRVPREQGGVEQVPISDVRGAPWFFIWTTDGGRFGRSAAH